MLVGRECLSVSVRVGRECLSVSGERVSKC